MIVAGDETGYDRKRGYFRETCFHALFGRGQGHKIADNSCMERSAVFSALEPAMGPVCDLNPLFFSEIPQRQK